MITYECAYCEGDIDSSEDSVVMECPHCNRTVFGCPVDGCTDTLKGKQGIQSHFTFASPKNKHTSSKRSEFEKKYNQWKQNQESQQRERSEEEIQNEWIDKNGSSYGSVLTEVPVGKGSISGQPRRIDIIAVREVLESPGYFGSKSTTQGEQRLIDEVQRRDDVSSEKKLHQLSRRHQGSELEVEVYEVKKTLEPQALGQLLVYSHRLPEEYDVRIVKQSIIFGKEYNRDLMCAQAAEKQGINISQV